MDLAQIEAVGDVEATDVVIAHPETGAPVLILTFAGPTHPAWQALKRKCRRESRGARELELLMTGTLDWKSADGTPADQPFDPEQMKALYRENRWLRRQAIVKLMPPFTEGRSGRASNTHG